jgi:hypothetical protein
VRIGKMVNCAAAHGPQQHVTDTVVPPCSKHGVSHRTWAIIAGIVMSALIRNANADPTPPADYFVAAEATVLGQTVTTGAIAGPLASTAFPDGYIEYDPSTGQFVTCSSCAGLVASQGAASGAADLATGQLHAAAGAKVLVAGFNVGYPAQSIAALGDTLYFVNPSASPTTFTTIGFAAHVDGTQNVGYNNGGAEFVIGVGPGQFGTPAPFGFNPTSATCSASATTDCVYNGYGTSTVWPGYDATVNQDFAGTFTFKGSVAAVPIFMELIANGQYGYTNFGDTATFSFDALPDGVSYTSASGDFLAGVPAPVIGCGLPVLLAVAGVLLGAELLERQKRPRSG